MLEQLDSYDWGHVFAYAGEQAGELKINPIVGYAGSTDGFSRKDVTEIVAIVEGENDEADWVCVGALKDGRWFGLRAGCDYTGWG